MNSEGIRLFNTSVLVSLQSVGAVLSATATNETCTISTGESVEVA